MPKLIFANLLNELMISAPEIAYAKNLSPVTVRKIWLSKAGDIVITPAPIRPDFKNYACALLNEPANDIVTLSPAGESTTYLADQLIADMALYTQVQDYLKKNPESFEMLCFAPDRPTLRLAKTCDVAISHYPTFPKTALVDLFYELNTKSGFRDMAKKLGFNVPAGVSCDGKESLIKNLALFFQSFDTLIITFNRSSNGYGHWIINKNQFAAMDFQQNLDQYLARYQQPHHFMVEEWIELTATPSVEMLVDDEGPHLLYICDQRCINAAYAGMVTPPLHLSPALIQQLITYGMEFGKQVYEQGFRGVFDLDACVNKNQTLVVTETNFRRTAGTFIDFLAKR